MKDAICLDNEWNKERGFGFQEGEHEVKDCGETNLRVRILTLMTGKESMSPVPVFNHPAYTAKTILTLRRGGEGGRNDAQAFLKGIIIIIIIIILKTIIISMIIVNGSNNNTNNTNNCNNKICSQSLRLSTSARQVQGLKAKKP